MFGQGSETTNQRRLSGQWRDGTFDPVLYANVAPRQEDGTELTDAHLGSGSFNSTGSAEPVDVLPLAALGALGRAAGDRGCAEYIK